MNSKSLSLVGVLLAGAGDTATYPVKLNMNSNAASSAGTAVALEPSGDGSLRNGTLPGGVPIEVRTLSGTANGLLAKVQGGNPLRLRFYQGRPRL